MLHCEAEATLAKVENIGRVFFTHTELRDRETTLFVISSGKSCILNF